jgi:hypothetical protein
MDALFLPYRYRKLSAWSAMRHDFGFEARDFDGCYCIDAPQPLPAGSTVDDSQDDRIDFVFRD